METIMKYRWEEYKDKVVELKEIFKNRTEGSDVEVEVVLPGEEGYDSKSGVPYVRIRFYVNNHVHERRIDLYEYHLKKSLDDLVNLIEHFIQEFEGEIEQSEYGGG